MNGFQHENPRLKKWASEKNSGQTQFVNPVTAQSAAYSALDEWHRSPKKAGNFAHFKMCLSGAGVPDALVEQIANAER